MLFSLVEDLNLISFIQLIIQKCQLKRYTDQIAQQDYIANNFDHKITMLKSKIIRARTEQKESKNVFPKLKTFKRMTTLHFFDQNANQKRKLSENGSRKSANRDYLQIRRCVDENQVQISNGKNSVKFSKKRLANEYMLVQQITPGSFSPVKTPKTSNLIDFAADQYQGQRDYNEDRILLNVNIKIMGKAFHLFGVFDGHGGSAASEFVKNNFTKTFEEQLSINPMLSILENLRKSLHKLESKICELAKSKNNIGGTCVSILILNQNSYYIAHVGDSRILSLKLNNETQNLQIKQMTTDHKPDDPIERRRIQSVGGKVYRNKLNLPNDNLQNYGPYRVLPGKLSVSRSLGDYDAKKQVNGQAISWEPELIQGNIQENTLFLLFSDGAYQKFSNEEISSFFTKSNKIQQIQIRKSIQALLINSILRQSTDNISIIAVGVKPI